MTRRNTSLQQQHRLYKPHVLMIDGDNLLLKKNLRIDLLKIIDEEADMKNGLVDLRTLYGALEKKVAEVEKKVVEIEKKAAENQKNHAKVIEFNSEARLFNSLVQDMNSELRPVRTPPDLHPWSESIHGWFSDELTTNDIKEMNDEDINEMLSFYQLSTSGSPKDKSDRFLAHLGAWHMVGK
ncbi:hypothetical protein M426DRAFT_8765 [Hypoxylon sp. CI-4A]|nr:hypothetical protein M426DRAFT_8765 [Hypoxylon sp. CI-4A]